MKYPNSKCDDTTCPIRTKIGCCPIVSCIKPDISDRPTLRALTPRYSEYTTSTDSCLILNIDKIDL